MGASSAVERCRSTVNRFLADSTNPRYALQSGNQYVLTRSHHSLEGVLHVESKNICSAVPLPCETSPIGYIEVPHLRVTFPHLLALICSVTWVGIHSFPHLHLHAKKS